MRRRSPRAFSRDFSRANASELIFNAAPGIFENRERERAIARAARRPREQSIALTALETRENVCGAMFTITASVYCPLEKTLNPDALPRKL
jgi:hypothetical protein